MQQAPIKTSPSNETKISSGFKIPLRKADLSAKVKMNSDSNWRLSGRGELNIQEHLDDDSNSKLPNILRNDYT